MSASAMLLHLILERFAHEEMPRVPEGDLIMTDAAQVAAFGDSGRDDGILAFLYFFHALQSLAVIRPGDDVLDLACGPANQMALLARLNPDARFVGVDASATMLERARATLARQGMRNVELLCDDMTRLDAIADASKDCVVCTMSLHHAPDQATLVRTLRQVRRVLKPDGGFYLADFGRLRRVATQRFLANDRRQRQTAQFTQDFFNSLQAAFSVGELSDAVAVLGSGVKRYRTALAPFMVIFRSAARREPDEATRHLARNWYGAMTPEQRREFRNFCRWFRAGGLGLPFDPA